MSKDKTKLLATTLGAISAITGGPYSSLDFPSIKIKPTVGTYNITRCRECGTSRDTLYKDGDTMICRKCKFKENKDESLSRK